jgi:hypothetical protein
MTAAYAIHLAAASLNARGRGSQRIVVGNDIDSGAVTHPFTGMLDDLRLYGRALGADEVARLSGDRPMVGKRSRGSP